jgi:quercetin dioxygenase-like cupin family protein
MSTVATSAETFAATVALFTEELGFALELITPADDPSMAIVVRGEHRVTIERKPEPGPVADRPLVIPPLVSELVVNRAEDDAAWVTGRAGMRYRDLIPSRLGGRFIASHIEVCDGGPVPDLVHHHAVRFQLIFCQRGWVDVVYEDQGAEFRMEAGDCVIQPPHIRHKVLASSAGACVVEIGCPAEHDTLFDHEMALPNDRVDDARQWDDQRFVRHVGADGEWIASEYDGFEEQVTAIAEATQGLADVRILRRSGPGSLTAMAAVDGEFDFLFVLQGTAAIDLPDEPLDAVEGDAIALAPGTTWSIDAAGDDFRLLRVRL